MAVKAATAPRGLTDEARALWRQIAKQWSADEMVPDARELMVLELACGELAMLRRLEARLEQEIDAGQLVVKGSMGQPVTSTLVAECRRSRSTVAALLRQLGFGEDDDGHDQGLVGPMTTAEAGRLGGLARRRI